MNSPPTKRVLDHWLSIGGEGGIPDRLALVPAAFSSVLGWTMTIEVPSMRIRVRGGHLEPWLSSTWRDYLHEAFDPLDAAAIALIGQELAAGRRVSRALRFSNDTRGSLLLLPLTMGFGEVCRAIGAVDHPGPIPGGLARIVRADHLRLVHSRPDHSVALLQAQGGGA